MRRAALVLIAALLLGGCASPGPFNDGSWFLPYHAHEGPHLWLGRTIVNTMLFATYVTVYAVGIAAESCMSSVWCRPCH